MESFLFLLSLLSSSLSFSPLLSASLNSYPLFDLNFFQIYTQLSASSLKCNDLLTDV